MSRPLNQVLAACCLLLAVPVLAVLALLVRLRLGRPVTYTQERAGLGERPFHLLKLRTMTEATGLDGRLLRDDQRLTSFGRWLRSTSLDELPELWNVVRGEMALVGPRPLPVAYLGRYTADEARRHEVLPGITGWAQVNGRNAVDWDERLAMDVWYVDHRSLWLDLRILWRTVSAVLRREGISAEGEATMHELRPHLANADDEKA